MPLVLRPFEDQAIEGLVSFIARAKPREAMTAEQINAQMRFASSIKVMKRVLVWDGAAIVGSMGFGYGIADPREPWFFKFTAFPDERHHEIASLLYEHLRVTMRSFAAPEARSQVREDDVYDVRFLAGSGFTEYARQWESRLELGTYDVEALTPKTAPPPGISYTTLAARGVDDAFLRALHALFCPLLADVPSPDPAPLPTFEKFCETFLDPKMRRPELFLVAMKDDAPVGLLVHREDGTEGTALQIDFLGVHRDYRKLGVALALKILGMRAAKELGYRSIRTWNDTANQRVLTLNGRLGFVRQPAWIHYARHIQTGSLDWAGKRPAHIPERKSKDRPKN